MAKCEKCGKTYLTRECLNCRDKNKTKLYGDKNLYEQGLKLKNKYKKETEYINENKLHDMKHANFLIRGIAILIDTVIIMLPLSLLLNSLIGEAIGAIVIILLWIFWNGQSVGKKILNLKIVDENYKDINVQTAIIRYLGYYISTIVFFIGYVIVPFRKDRKSLHDLIAKTYVIHTDKKNTEIENDTADKILSVMSIFIGTTLIVTLIMQYQQNKEINKLFYGTNSKYQIEKQNKALINQINQMQKMTNETMKKLNQGFKPINFNNSQRNN